MAAAAARAKELAVAAGKFIDSTPTPFHLCAQSAELLRAAGFVELVETEAWRPLLKPGGNYFYVRGGTLVAFAIGAGFVSGGGFSIIGAHTDSPVLKLKPCSKRSGKGYQQVNPYPSPSPSPKPRLVRGELEVLLVVVTNPNPDPNPNPNPSPGRRRGVRRWAALARPPSL